MCSYFPGTSMALAAIVTSPVCDGIAAFGRAATSFAAKGGRPKRCYTRNSENLPCDATSSVTSSSAQSRDSQISRTSS
jgi:hypothetical protein